MTMNIIQRNCIRLLRIGAFGEKLAIEPMSDWKWERARFFSQRHDIIVWTFDGLMASASDFLCNITQTQTERWRQDAAAASADDRISEEEEEEEEEERLNNPLLNRRLNRFLEESTKAQQTTGELLLRLVGIAHELLTRGINLQHLVELGIYLRTTHDRIDYDLLNSWIQKLHMARMTQLTSSLLVALFDFHAEEIPFAEPKQPKLAQRFINGFMKMSGNEMEEWYFTQGDHIFVGTNNTRSFIWHLRHSMKYGYLYPLESPFHFLCDLIHSLSRIEE